MNKNLKAALIAGGLLLTATLLSVGLKALDAWLHTLPIEDMIAGKAAILTAIVIGMFFFVKHVISDEDENS